MKNITTSEIHFLWRWKDYFAYKRNGALRVADFEESEYRGPLYNQLEWGNHLLWEPGQVFEKHIGIDRASMCTNSYLWSMHGFLNPLGGALMHRRNWGFIWSRRKKRKELPNFQLNLFLQAKRPYRLSSGSKDLKAKGIKAGCWKFEITAHQQIALEKLDAKLAGDALVCYASPSFHIQSDLYKHTISKTIVENSTFPSAKCLRNHSAWYYDQPGATGCANPEFESIQEAGLEQRIRALVERTSEKFTGGELENGESLLKLANLVYEFVIEDGPSFASARFSEEIQDISDYVDAAELDDNADYVKSYLSIIAFCYFYKLQWFVIG